MLLQMLGKEIGYNQGISLPDATVRHSCLEGGFSDEPNVQ